MPRVLRRQLRSPAGVSRVPSRGARACIQTVLAALAAASSAVAQEPGRIRALDPEGIQRIVQETGGAARVSVHGSTGAAVFVRVDPRSGRSLSPLPATAPTEQKSAAFFDRHGRIFGISRPDAELALVRSSRDAMGGVHLTYRQLHLGVPVFGGELKSHFDPAGHLTAVNGTFVPDIALDPTPSVSEMAAGRTAIAKVRSDRRASLDLSIHRTALYVYRDGLARGLPGKNHLAWEVEVRGGDLIREFVYIDAHTGRFVDQITGIFDALSRRVYDDFVNYPNNPYWVEGDAFPTASTDANNVIVGSGESYQFFSNAFGRDSFDGAGAIMHGVFNRTGGCPNAAWSGERTSFCPDVTGDDTVAHEWAHAYTQYTDNLVYAWQPGALNESYSDIWGDTVDLLNGRGTDAPGGQRTVGVCTKYLGGGLSAEDSYRWLVSEDSIGFGQPIRDMWDPTCAGGPGKVSDFQYTCQPFDHGGVHTNSGVPNHAFALLVDGGTYNNQSVVGVGLTKAAHVYWRAATVYQSPLTNFLEHADAIEQSCADLVGENLTDLWSGSPSGQALASSDCDQVAKAAAAVELRTPPFDCMFEPLLAKEPPAQCLVRAFYDAGFESGAQGWTASRFEVVPAEFIDRDWQRVTELPDGRPGYAFLAPDPDALDSEQCEAMGDQSGVLSLESPAIAVPANVSSLYLAFDHYMTSEANYDGGNLRMSVNGGPWTPIPKSDFTYNPYNRELLSAESNSNPLASQDAFSGTDGGTVEGSWGQSQILLPTSLAGQSIRLRFEFGTNECFGGYYGWFVDDVRFIDRDFSATVKIGSCNPAISNTELPTGCTITDLLRECAENAPAHDIYTGCVGQVATSLKQAGVITNKQKTALIQCATIANIP
jgi:bacillolysin